MTKEEADDASVQPTAQQIADRWAARMRQIHSGSTAFDNAGLSAERYRQWVERAMPIWQEIRRLSRQRRKPRQS